MMARSLVFVAIVLLAADKPQEITFEDSKGGTLPKGWSAAKTGEGPGSVWKVIEDDSSPHGKQVLAQTSSEGPNPLFNLCVLDEPQLVDVDLAVSFKAVSGKTDQGGGPMWRYQDAKNYYIARMNPLEDNYRVYKVVDGKRTQLGTAAVEAPTSKWHKLRIVQRGDRIQCYLNDKLYLDVKDDTFEGKGKMGLWTKADAVTSFDGLRVGAPQE